LIFSVKKDKITADNRPLKNEMYIMGGPNFPFRLMQGKFGERSTRGERKSRFHIGTKARSVVR